MFDNLIESGRKPEKRKFLGVGFVSLVIHAGLIGAAAYATLGANETDQKVLIDTLNVFLNQQQEQKPPEQQVIMPDVPLKGFQTVVAPDIIPTSIPQINLTEHFDPKDYSGTGVEGGVANGLTPSSDALYTSAIVEEQPERLAGPTPTFPPLLLQAGIKGRVMVQAVIDTTGHVESNSIKILSSPNPGFNPGVIDALRRSVFRPARVHGRAVRVLIQLPFDFNPTTH
ncbi:MAG TPA: energy transducer TonB [Gemmatimonadales bacterium]